MKGLIDAHGNPIGAHFMLATDGNLISHSCKDVGGLSESLCLRRGGSI